MRVTWVTDDQSSPSIVEYGTSPGRYSSVAQGESTSYSYLFYFSFNFNNFLRTLPQSTSLENLEVSHNKK
jgi:hypothetical protein